MVLHGKGTGTRGSDASDVNKFYVNILLKKFLKFCPKLIKQYKINIARRNVEIYPKLFYCARCLHRCDPPHKGPKR